MFITCLRLLNEKCRYDLILINNRNFRVEANIRDIEELGTKTYVSIHVTAK